MSGSSPATVNGHTNSPVFNDFQPSLAGTLTAPKPDVVQGIKFNAPWEKTGLPVITTDQGGPSFHPENSSNPLINNQFVKQGAAAANSLLGSFFGVVSDSDKLLQNSLMKQTKTAENASQVQGAPLSADQIKRGANGQGFGPTVSEQAGDVLKTAVGALSLTPGFALTSAGMAAAREIDIPGVGKPFAAIQDFVFGNLSKGIDTGVSKTFDALNLDPEVRKNVEAPIAAIVNIAAQMAIFHKAGDVIGKTGEFVAEKAGASEATQAKVGNLSKSAIDAAINPYGPVFSAMKTGIVNGLDKFKKSGVPITPDIANKVVSDTVKTVPIPDDKGVMPISTPGGEIQVHTDHATVLQHLLKDGENLDFKTATDLGTDETGKPVQARFSWNFDTQKGTLEVADTATAVNLSHEIGHAIDTTLKTDLSKILGGNVPNYLQNKTATDKMILDMAVGNLEGNGSATQIRDEAVRVASELAQEAKRTAAVAKRAAEGKSFVDGLGDRAKIVDESTPMLKKMVDFAKGKDVFAKQKETLAPKESPSKPRQQDLLSSEVTKAIGSTQEGGQKSSGIPQGDLTKKVEQQPISGETKTSGLAKGVEAKAIENKLTQGFSDLPEYQTINFKDQAKKALDLLRSDPELAKRIAMGNELPPHGLLPESVFMAVEEAATKNNDVQTLQELATSSGLNTEASAMGQRIGILRERNPDSVVAKIQDVVKAREEGALKTLKGKSVEKAKSEILKEIKKDQKKTTKGDIDELLDVIKC